MIHPNFNEEKKLWKQGFNFVFGLDEAGRGPLAGPVVAAAVMVKPEHLFYKKISARRSLKIFKKNFGLRDSKKLSQKQREFFYEKLTNNKDIQWGIGVVSEKIIDKINILEATKMAMQKALKNLKTRLQNNPLQKIDDRQFSAEGGFLLIDGNFSLKTKIPQKPIIKGDEKVFSCAAAGIIAKVTRDRIMLKMHKKYPHYGFNLHKGYGTKLHIKNLSKFGLCKIHRKTFEPVRVTKHIRADFSGLNSDKLQGARKGIDVDKHRSRRVTKKLV